MNNKNIIIAGAIAIGIYLFSQGKAIFSAHPTQTMRQKAAQKVDISRLPVAQIRYMIAHAAAQKKTGKEVAALKAEEARRVALWKVRHKVAQKRIGVPISRTVYLAALRKAAVRKAAAQKVDISRLPVAQIRYMIAHAAAQKKTGKEVAALKAEEARRVALWKVRHKVASKRIGRPITRATYIAAARKKAAVRKAAAQKIGKKIGKKVAQKVVPKILEETGGRTGMARYIYLKKKAAGMRAAATQAVNAARTRSKIKLPFSRWAGGRTGMALAIYLKKRVIALEQAAEQAKAAIIRPASKLFPGAEKSRIIPYSESSKHSYYGPKSHKLQNEGYMVEWQKRYKNSVEAYDIAREMDVLRNRKPWQR